MICKCFLLALGGLLLAWGGFQILAPYTPPASAVALGWGICWLALAQAISALKDKK